MLLPRMGMAERFLGRTQLTWCSVMILAMSLMTACDSEKWVDVAMPLSPAEFEAMKKNPNAMENFKMVARPACSQAGKSYTGEARYEKGGVQVQCK